MTNDARKVYALLAMMLFVFAAAGSAAEMAKKVAVLPFEINAAQDLGYLREGILDMLASRLYWEGKVEIIEKQVVKKAMASRQGPLNEAVAREVGGELEADYVLFGSLTIFGESVSIDAKMVPLTGEKPPVTAYAQTKGMEDVIPRINDFAQDINSKIFGRASVAMAAVQQQPRFSQANPEKLMVPTAPTAPTAPAVPSGQAGEGRSELNPNFVAPQTVQQTGSFWQSQSLDLAITSMAVADVNQDGILEILLLSPTALCIYQQAAINLRLIKKYEGARDDHFIWVSAADLNGNGIPEIYVSNRRREQLMSSFVLEWNGSDWARTAESVRYHVRAMELPDKGTVLLGQEGREDEPFFGSVFILKKAGTEFQPLEGVELPVRASVYSFNLADLTQNGSAEVLVLDSSGKLKISGTNKETLWESAAQFAASFDYLKGRETSPGARLGVEEREKVYLNAPILTANLTSAQRPEVLVNKNISGSLGGRRFFNVNFFGQSELYSFSWNGLTMVENWHTPTFPGMTTAYEVADLNGDGGPELVVALVSDPGGAVWKKAKSKLIAYPIAATGKASDGKS